MAFPAEGADAAPAPDQRMLRKQCRFDRQNVIARDVPSRVDAFENDMQRGTVAVGNIRNAESSAQLCLASNAKFESVTLIRFQKLIDVPGLTADPRVGRHFLTAAIKDFFSGARCGWPQ
jgi:hypothetical protein